MLNRFIWYFQDFTGGELDDDIYAELEAQRDALVNLHKKKEAELEKSKTDETKQEVPKLWIYNCISEN